MGQRNVSPGFKTPIRTKDKKYSERTGIGKEFYCSNLGESFPSFTYL